MTGPSAQQQWAGLRSAAADGTLMLEPSALPDLVDAATNARYWVNTVKRSVDTVAELVDFSSLESGKQLSKQFEAKAEELKTILGKHETVLDDVSSTFLDAARHYEGAESDSSVDMNALRTEIEKSKTEGMTLPAPQPTAGLLPEPGTAVTLPANLADGKTFDPAGMKAESPTGYNYDQLQTIRNSLSTVPGNLAHNALFWGTLASSLKTGFDDLNTKVEASKKSWTSPGGATKAMSAMSAYHSGNETLVDQVEQVKSALEYSVLWTDATAKQLATALMLPRCYSDPNGTQAQTDKENCAKNAREVMWNVYVPGVNSTTSHIATLPEPTAPTTGDGSGNGNGNGNGSGSGSGSGSGAGSGSGSGSGSSAALAAFDRALSQLQQQESGAGKDNGGQDGRTGGNGDSSTDSSGSSSAGQLTSAAQSALDQASSAAQSALEQASSAADQSSLAGIPGSALSSLQDQAKKALSAASKGGGGGGGSGAGGAGAGPGGLSPSLDSASKLFPRASVSTGAESAIRAGLAATAGSPMGGMPMAPMGGAGAGGQGQQKEHKRADYLDSTTHLDDALGDAPIVARPVVEQ
ncbi:hypothetical protein [Nocardia sp. SSK8]|uniref:hypothetical protein n=1 Tax=Nocardia sp. SSK8 TaxID=3120154 RepID=UPI003009813E